jgi:hypothetical protein
VGHVAVMRKEKICLENIMGSGMCGMVILQVAFKDRTQSLLSVAHVINSNINRFLYNLKHF